VRHSRPLPVDQPHTGPSDRALIDTSLFELALQVPMSHVDASSYDVWKDERLQQFVSEGTAPNVQKPRDPRA